jgi:three-Cys-motif partner protein
MIDPAQDFFDTPHEHSLVKAQIVFKYVQTWARVLSDYQRSAKKKPDIAYVDLFSGPGIYGDGTSSTPMLVLKAAIEDEKLRTALRTYFNDGSEEQIKTLREAISELPGLDSLRYKPQISSQPATLQLIDSMQIPPRIPRLYFLDQFGYKHVTLDMIKSLMEGWSECIFFFNYRRVIAAINNPAMTENMLAIFGDSETLSKLKKSLEQGGTATSREEIVMSCLIEVLRLAGAKYVQPFSFKVEDQQRSTHHLIFLSNHEKGYTIMKGIMAREGTLSPEGLPYLSYIRNQFPVTLDLFATPWHEKLGEELCETFAGQTATVEELFVKHSPGKNFLPPHYKEALLRLEDEGKITTSPTSEMRPVNKGKRTMALTTRVTFRRKAR